MTYADIQTAPARQPLRFFKSIATFAAKRPQRAATSEQDDRARRAFVLEMMEAQPEAFQHELDVQGMMYLYPSRF